LVILLDVMLLNYALLLKQNIAEYYRKIARATK